MKKKFIYLSILLIGMVLVLPLSASAKQKDGKRKEINWSININRHPDSIRTTLVNLGLITNLQQQHGCGINVLYSAVHREMCGFQLSGIMDYAYQAYGVQIGGLGSFVRANGAGLMVSGLINGVGGDYRGVHIAGIANITGEHFNGFALGGIMNVASGAVNGVQLATVINASGGQLNGTQLSLLSNVGVDVEGFQSAMISNIAAERIRGMQLAGVANIAVDADKAFQLSSLTNICLDEMQGMQLSLGNYANRLEGVQLGVINLSTGSSDGWQIGILNHSKDSAVHKLGLININPKTKIQAMFFGSNTNKINLAVRFKNKTNYSIFGLGTHYLDMNHDFSGSLYYRTGLYFPLPKKFELSGDVGYFHIENFEDKDVEAPDRLYSLQLRINVEYKLLRKLGLFLSTGYAMTRYYHHNRLFNNKGIIEGGIILF